MGYDAAIRAGMHDPEKWEPVFGQDHAQTKILRAQRDCALGWMGQRDDAEKRDRIGGRPWQADAAV
jgi:hypothetical protein